jgi:hypothetical protein
MTFQPISEFKPHEVTGPETVSKLFLLIIAEKDSVNEKDYVLAYSFPSSKFFSILNCGIVNYSNFKSSNCNIEILKFKALPKLKN